MGKNREDRKVEEEGLTGNATGEGRGHSQECSPTFSRWRYRNRAHLLEASYPWLGGTTGKPSHGGRIPRTGGPARSQDGQASKWVGGVLPQGFDVVPGPFLYDQMCRAARYSKNEC
jgi:hypothetical protein